MPEWERRLGVAVGHSIFVGREDPMARQPKQLDELFHEGLKDIYFAEKKILVALPKMAKAAQLDKAKAAFEKHHAETEKQVERLEQIFAMIEKEPHGKQCPAILYRCGECSHHPRVCARSQSRAPAEVLENDRPSGAILVIAAQPSLALGDPGKAVWRVRTVSSPCTGRVGPIFQPLRLVSDARASATPYRFR
jgi:hypothetical protein